MDDAEYMPKFNIQKESHKLTKVETEYLKRLNQQNFERVQKWNHIRTRNRYLGTVLGISVISIYSYTLWAIKQENFLDDFSEPEKIID